MNYFYPVNDRFFRAFENVVFFCSPSDEARHGSFRIIEKPIRESAKLRLQSLMEHTVKKHRDRMRHCSSKFTFVRKVTEIIVCLLQMFSCVCESPLIKSSNQEDRDDAWTEIHIPVREFHVYELKMVLDYLHGIITRPLILVRTEVYTKTGESVWIFFLVKWITTPTDHADESVVLGLGGENPHSKQIRKRCIGSDGVPVFSGSKRVCSSFHSADSG